MNWTSRTEQGYYEACTGVIRKKLYELVLFYSRTMSTKWNHDNFEVGMEYGTTNGSEADLRLERSKLIACANAYLIWCPYID